MDTKRIALMGGMVALAAVMFFQIKRLGNTNTAPVQVVKKVQEIPMSHILVTNQTVPYGIRFNEEMLEWQKWPTEHLSEVFIDQDVWPTAAEDLLQAVARFELAAGEPITERKIVRPGSRGIMSALLKPGHRAVSIRITTDAAAAGFIRPGDHVDIIMTRRVTGVEGRGIFADTIFENVQILSVDQRFSQGADGSAAIKGSMVSLELSQEDAELITVAQASGDLSLTLRPMAKDHVRNVATKSSQDAISNEGAPEDVSALTLYRGGTTDTVALRGN